MAKLLEYIKIAWFNLKSNRKRTMLTMLGIIIGISAVIMIMAAGGGAKESINEDLDAAFSGQIYFFVKDPEKAGFNTFSEEDVNYIMEHSNDIVLGASQDLSYSGKAKSVRGVNDINVKFGTAVQKYCSTQPIIKGAYYTDSDYESANAVGVVNEATARKFFGTTDVIGKTLELTIENNSYDIRIVGVREDADNSVISGALLGTDNIQIEVPTTVGERKFGLWLNDVRYLLIMADKEHTYEAVEQAKHMLEKKHNIIGKDALGLENWTDYAQTYDSIFSMVTLLVAVVAAIALVVGGIGVMNIMLVSVTERTREIGIRKSLGARTKTILLQFLAEAGLITMIGGIIGIVIGLVLAKLICLILGAPVVVSPVFVLGATAFSCGIGLFFGIYPAKKAAHLNPIEALRHE